MLSQDLPRQGEGERSKATLFRYGVRYEIVLDGTPDGEFFVQEKVE